MQQNPVVMYVDMNSFFASCEQQEHEVLRGRPVGVITHPSPNACIIAPSVEAKRFKVKTGMRLPDGKALCPELVPVLARPYIYRQYHLKIMDVLKSYCPDTMAKSIDEAAMNLTNYHWVYPDMVALAKQIKADLARVCGEYVKCSIGIAPNTFLAKLGTELQKPDGLVEITPENIDEQLAKLQLTDLPGIASANERRLKTIGIHTPLQLRHSSEALLRKAFGGIVGEYWHRRLHFKEIDIYSNPYRAMSATRMVSRQQRENKQALESLFISLCTRLEQRMVKQGVFCRDLHFFIGYYDMPGWETKVHLNDPTQDAVEMRRYVMRDIEAFEQQHGYTLFNNKVQRLGITISGFIKGERMQYSLFDNKIKQDKARKTLYDIKDRYGRDTVRKASETIMAYEMRDAIGFGSIKDFAGGESDVNDYLLQDDRPQEVPKHIQELRERKAKALKAAGLI